jgi:hypothetical protein
MRWVKDWHQAPVASTRTLGMEKLCDLPVAVGGSALGCTGDLESTFFDESLGELPMIEFGVARVGGRNDV